MKMRTEHYVYHLFKFMFHWYKPNTIHYLFSVRIISPSSEYSGASNSRKVSQTRRSAFCKSSASSYLIM